MAAPGIPIAKARGVGDLKMPRMTQGWLAVIQILTAPLIALITVKMTMRFEVKKSLINGSFSTKQEVYEDLYGVVSLVNRKLKSIFTDIWITPNMDAIAELEDEIDEYDSYDIEAKIAIYGTNEMKKIISEWMENRENFLGNVFLVRSGTIGKGKNRTNAKNDMKKYYELCSQSEKALLKSIQTELGLFIKS